MDLGDYMSRNRRPLQTLAIVVTTAALVFAGTSSAFAARGGGGGKKPGGGGGSTSGTATISLVLVNSPDSVANYGETVTFNISTTATSQPWVQLKCSQGGKVVAEGWNGYFEGSLTGRNFMLASPSWTGGAADCTATVTTPQWQPLGSTSFHVEA